MKINYHGAILSISITTPYHRSLAKGSVKDFLNRIGFKKKDSFADMLSVSFDIISTEETPVVIDVGCNIGAFSLPLAKRFPNAKIFSIEPHPISGGRYVHNMRLNDLSNVTFISAATALISGNIIELFSCPTNSGGHRVTRFAGRDDLPEQTFEEHLYVPSLRLDDLFAQLSIEKVTLLKIDVEGYEFHVLSSLGKHLTPEIVPAIIAEYGPEGMRVAGHTGEDLYLLMDNAGYQCVDLSSQKVIKTPDDIPDIADFCTTDFLFTPKRQSNLKGIY